MVLANQKYDEAYAVILNQAKEKNAPLFALNKAMITIDAIGFKGAQFHMIYDALEADIKTKLVGYHQVQNAACALLSLCVLSQYTEVNLSPESILEGIYRTEWICRMEVVSHKPLIIIDGAHNEHAAEFLVKSISDFIPNGKVNAIFGVMQRKNYIPIVKKISKIAKQIYTVTIEGDESVDGHELAEELKEFGMNAANIGTVDATLNTLKNQKNVPILICGSLHLAGIARKLII